MPAVAVGSKLSSSRSSAAAGRMKPCVEAKWYSGVGARQVV